MSYLTDEARAASRAAKPDVDVPGQMLEDIVAANPARRRCCAAAWACRWLSVRQRPAGRLWRR